MQQNTPEDLRRGYGRGIVDLVILVDDASHDETPAIASVFPHMQVHGRLRAEGAFRYGSTSAPSR
jgi:glycosyltransferase involved in cell wall biosynthesis